MSYYLVVRRYAPFSTFGGGFEGDIRQSASVDPLATARTIGVVTFDSVSVQAFMGYSSGSTFDGAGPWVSKVIGRHFSQVKTTLANERQIGNRLSFTVHTAGANPLLPLVAPDIDTFVDIAVEFMSSGLNVAGAVRGDGFPNAELILLDENLQSQMLFDYRTSGGRQTGPASLFGANADNVLGVFSAAIQLGGGGFVSPNPSCGPTFQGNTAAKRETWSGGGGRFSGGGAGGRW